MMGRAVRWQRIFPGSGRALFSVPLDHALSLGPIAGLEEASGLVRALGRAGADLILVPKGAVRHIVPALGDRLLLGVHLSASTALGPHPDHKVRVGTAAEAASLGADLVSVQVNFGGAGEGEMLADLGRTVEECARVGLPLLAMVYVKGDHPPTAEELRHACRAAAEIGADIVKTVPPEAPGEFRKLIETTPVPVLVGGGPMRGTGPAMLAWVAAQLDAGAAGICLGRNLFQRRPLEPFARRMAARVHARPWREPVG